MSMKSLFALIGLCVIGSVLSHPIPTFLFIQTDSQGNVLPIQFTPGLTAGIQQDVYFQFEDLQHNQEVVQFKNVMLMHNKWIHILCVSLDNLYAAHIHPDDFENMTLSNPNRTMFHVKMTFPAVGTYAIAASFMYNDVKNKTWREGFAQSEFLVTATPGVTVPTMNPKESNITRDYSTTKHFETYTFDNLNEEIYDKWVNTTANTVTSGYYATLQVAVNGTLKSLSSNNTGLIPTQCTYFVVNVYKSDGTPAKIVSLMSAPAHFTITNYDGAVYHAHGTYLSPGQTFQQVLDYVGTTDMMDLMKLPPTDPKYSEYMGAMMIGVTTLGELNCWTDDGTVMKEMDDMKMPMNMNTWDGPASWSTVASIFNFPDPGNWRMWVYMKLENDDGSQVLFVPQFDVNVLPQVYPSVPDQSSAEGEDSSAHVIGVSVMSLVTLLAMFY